MDKKAKVIELLEGVLDPDIGINIIDLGLVYNVAADADGITVDMTLTTRDCPVSQSLVEEVEFRILYNLPKEKYKVNLIFDPPWENSFISKKGLAFLGFPEVV